MAEPFLAEIRVFPFGFAPSGWLECNGQVLAIQSNQALFSIIGTYYGGDGTTNFRLPDLRGRVPVNPGRGITLAEVGGEEAHPLTTNEMPAHIHQVNADTASATSNLPAGNVWGKSTSKAYTNTVNSRMNPSALGVTGNSQPHDNMQPYTAFTFCIAINGIFPSRN